MGEVVDVQCPGCFQCKHLYRFDVVVAQQTKTAMYKMRLCADCSRIIIGLIADAAEGVNNAVQGTTPPAPHGGRGA